MNGAHIHLIFNHFPLTGLFFSLVILGTGFLRSNYSIICSGLLIALISGILAVPTYLSGEPAEKVIENSQTFSEALVEEHEDAAFFAIWTAGITAVAAGIGLIMFKKKKMIPRPLLIAILILNLFTLTVIGRTNFLGGKISHPEVRD